MGGGAVRDSGGDTARARPAYGRESHARHGDTVVAARALRRTTGLDGHSPGCAARTGRTPGRWVRPRLRVGRDGRRARLWTPAPEVASRLESGDDVHSGGSDRLPAR